MTIISIIKRKFISSTGLHYGFSPCFQLHPKLGGTKCFTFTMLFFFCMCLIFWNTIPTQIKMHRQLNIQVWFMQQRRRHTHSTVRSWQIYNFNVTVFWEFLVSLIANIAFNTYVKYVPHNASRWAISLKLVNTHSKTINNFVHIIINFHLFLTISRLMWKWKATKTSLISKKSFQI